MARHGTALISIAGFRLQRGRESIPSVKAWSLQMSTNRRIEGRVGERSARFEVFDEETEETCVASYRVKPTTEPGMPEFTVVDEFLIGIIGWYHDFGSAVEDAFAMASAEL
jgi:hypothetical protein